MNYDVFDVDFKKVGVVVAGDSNEALVMAKKKFPFVVAPMVQLTPPQTPVPSRIAAKVYAARKQ